MYCCKEIGRPSKDKYMFGKKKKTKDQKAYEAKLKEAMEAQRAGKIERYADLMTEAEALEKKLPPPTP